MFDNKKKMAAGFVLTTAVAVSAIVSGSILTRGKDLVQSGADDVSYSHTINDGLSVSSDATTVTLASGYQLGFSLTSYTAGSGSFGTIAAGGEFANTTVISGLTSVDVVLASGSLEFYYGWNPYGTIVYNSTPTTLSASGTYTLPTSADYFKVYAQSASVITSLTFHYSCAEPTTVSSFTLTINTPTVGTSDSISDTNYLWINTDLVAQGTWVSYLCTEDASGNWSYTFSNLAVTGDTAYTVKALLSDSSSTLSSWSYAWTYSSYNVTLAAGMGELAITGAVFSSQPSVASTTYTLSVTLDITASISTMTYLGLQYAYTNSGDPGNWSSFGLSDTVYTTSVSDLDVSKTLYYRVKIGDSTYGEVFVCADTNWTLFSLTATANKSITITASYSSSIGSGSGYYVIAGTVA